MMNSQQEDSKDTNAEGNDSCSFDVLGKKICLTLYNPKIKAQKIPADLPCEERFCLSCLFVCFSYEVLCVACQWLVMLWHNNPKGEGGTPYNGLYG